MVEWEEVEWEGGEVEVRVGVDMVKAASKAGVIKKRGRGRPRKDPKAGWCPDCRAEAEEAGPSGEQARAGTSGAGASGASGVGRAASGEAESSREQFRVVYPKAGPSGVRAGPGSCGRGITPLPDVFYDGDDSSSVEFGSWHELSVIEEVEIIELSATEEVEITEDVIIPHPPEQAAAAPQDADVELLEQEGDVVSWERASGRLGRDGAGNWSRSGHNMSFRYY